MVKASFAPWVTTYNALLDALAQGRDWKAAEPVIKERGVGRAFQAL